MRLATFILQDMEGIVSAWEAFAALQLPAAKDMAPLELRDHAREILRAIATDLQTSQTRWEQSEKSQGRAPASACAPETAAQTHAVLRARSGFDINQLVAEYRALRASVLRRWLDRGPLDETSLDDLIRFNEAIDQAVAESVGHFHEQVERARDLLLGMLGHDMRSPLSTIMVTASHLSRLHAGEEVTNAAARLMRSGSSMRALLDDLVDFNRTRLGLGIKVSPADIDLVRVLNDEVEQLRGAHPDRLIEVEMPGALRGQWDGGRLQQVLRNLVLNAVRYGVPGDPIRVRVAGQASNVVIEVVNGGPALDPAHLAELFEPLKRGPGANAAPSSESGLGLGLFIVREIVSAHGGQVAVRCGEDETTFSVQLPR